MTDDRNMMLLRHYYRRTFGSHRALVQLVDENYEWVMGAAIGKARSEDQAKDLAHDVWTKVVLSRGTPSAWSGRGSVKAWIRSILDKTWIDHLRRKATRRKEVPVDDFTPATHMVRVDPTDRYALETCQDKLTDEDEFAAKVFVLRLYLQYTWPEVIELVEDELGDVPKLEDRRNRCRAAARRATAFMLQCLDARPEAPAPRSKESRP